MALPLHLCKRKIFQVELNHHMKRISLVLRTCNGRLSNKKLNSLRFTHSIYNTQWQPSSFWNKPCDHRHVFLVSLYCVVASCTTTTMGFCIFFNFAFYDIDSCFSILIDIKSHVDRMITKLLPQPCPVSHLEHIVTIHSHCNISPQTSLYLTLAPSSRWQPSDPLAQNHKS